MQNVISDMLSAWKGYWGKGFYPWLLLLAIVYLVLFFRKKEVIRQMLFYVGILLFLFFCPVTAWLIQKCVGGDVYWRVLWLLPTVPLLAYGGTALIYGSRDSKSPTADEPKEAVADGQKKTADVQWQTVTNERETEVSRFSVRILLLVLLLAGIVVSGKSLMDAGFYERVHNFQKVPDEAAQICDLINKQKEEGEVIYLAADDNIAAYVRVYDPSILMPYGRGGKGRTTQAARKLYTQLTSGMPVIKKVVKYAKSLECNYLVFPLPSQKKQDYMAMKGYFLIGQVNSYGIFKYIEPNE